MNESNGWNGPVIQRGMMAADVAGRQFTQISNEFFRDPRLSAAAKGVFGLISTHRDGYGITPELIARYMKSGVTAIKTALRELEKYGYLVRTRIRREDGTLGGSVYKITDMPVGLAIIESAPYPESRFRRSEPADGIPPLDSEPTDGIPSLGLTCENEAPEASFPRSEPADGKPTVVEQEVVDLLHKNTSHKNTRFEKTKNTSSSPPSSEPPERDGEPAREEEATPTALKDTSEARDLVGQAIAQWKLTKPISEAECAPIVARVVEALADGCKPADVLHELTRDLETARSVVGVIRKRIENDGWAKAVAAVATDPDDEAPDWVDKCGQCDANRQIEVEIDDIDSYGYVKTIPARCPRCHPYRNKTKAS